MPLDFSLPDHPFVDVDHGTEIDVERATKEYLFSTGRYENPEVVWEDVPYHIKYQAVLYTKRIIIAALGGDPDEAVSFLRLKGSL